MKYKKRERERKRWKKNKNKRDLNMYGPDRQQAADESRGVMNKAGPWEPDIDRGHGSVL